MRLSAADSRQILAFVECRWHVSGGIYPISSDVHGHVDGLSWRINKKGRDFPIPRRSERNGRLRGVPGTSGSNNTEFISEAEQDEEIN